MKLRTAANQKHNVKTYENMATYFGRRETLGNIERYLTPPYIAAPLLQDLRPSGQAFFETRSGLYVGEIWRSTFNDTLGLLDELQTELVSEGKTVEQMIGIVGVQGTVLDTLTSRVNRLAARREPFDLSEATQYPIKNT